MNIPIGILGLVLTPFLIGESRGATAESYDVPGAVLVTSGLVTLVYPSLKRTATAGTIETIGLFYQPA